MALSLAASYYEGDGCGWSLSTVHEELCMSEEERPLLKRIEWWLFRTYFLERSKPITIADCILVNRRGPTQQEAKERRLREGDDSQEYNIEDPGRLAYGYWRWITCNLNQEDAHVPTVMLAMKLLMKKGKLPSGPRFTLWCRIVDKIAARSRVTPERIIQGLQDIYKDPTRSNNYDAGGSRSQDSHEETAADPRGEISCSSGMREWVDREKDVQLASEDSARSIADHQDLVVREEDVVDSCERLHLCE